MSEKIQTPSGADTSARSTPATEFVQHYTLALTNPQRLVFAGRLVAIFRDACATGLTYQDREDALATLERLRSDLEAAPARAQLGQSPLLA